MNMDQLEEHDYQLVYRLHIQQSLSQNYMRHNFLENVFLREQLTLDQYNLVSSQKAF